MVDRSIWEAIPKVIFLHVCHLIFSFIVLLFLWLINGSLEGHMVRPEYISGPVYPVYCYSLLFVFYAFLNVVSANP